jgi:hypothetical protein
MTKMSVVVQAVLLALCATLALWVSRVTDDERPQAAASVLFAGKPDTISSVQYVWPAGSVQVTQAGGYFVVDLDREREAAATKPDAPKDGKKDAAPAAEAAAPAVVPTPERERARFRGAKVVDDAMKALAPFVAKRALGEVDDSRKQAMGLSSPKRRLTLKAAQGEMTFDVGESVYGGQGRYLMRQGDPLVYVVDNAVVLGLEGSVDSLLEKRVLVADVAEIEALDVVLGTSRAAFVHKDREQSAKRQLVDKTGTADGNAQKLLDTLLTTRGTALVDASVKGSPRLSVVVRTTTGTTTVEVCERTDAGGFVASTVGGFVLVLSEAQARTLLDDAEALFP